MNNLGHYVALNNLSTKYSDVTVFVERCLLHVFAFGEYWGKRIHQGMRDGSLDGIEGRREVEIK